MTYSLLQSLFNDGVDGNPTNLSAESCRNWVKQFLGAGVVSDASASGSEAESFENVRFVKIPSALEAFCKQKTIGARITNTEDDKRILKAAHKKLREVYDKHIENIVGIMRNVLSMRRNRVDPSDIKFQLNEIFVKDARGANAVLESIIGQARDVIAKHLLDVEMVYIGALVEMSRGKRGYIAPAAPTPSV
jgi:hypothetical protein